MGAETKSDCCDVKSGGKESGYHDLPKGGGVRRKNHESRWTRKKWQGIRRIDRRQLRKILKINGVTREKVEPKSGHIGELTTMG